MADVQQSAESGAEKSESAAFELQLYFTFPLDSQLTRCRVQICDLIMMCSTFEEKEIKKQEGTSWIRYVSLDRNGYLQVFRLSRNHPNGAALVV